MLTRDGKVLKKIQMEMGLKAKDFADQLEIHPSYLSAIMNGNRDLPQNLVDRIETKFEVDREVLFKLRNSKLLN